jgi:NADH-quinone oxidoreductase subunit A
MYTAKCLVVRPIPPDGRGRSPAPTQFCASEGGYAVSENVISGYLPILIYVGVVVALGVAMLIGSEILGRVLRQRNPTSEKNSTYECGMLPFKDARHRFDIRFYLVAMLFILFDIEVVFMYPWAVIYNKFNPVIFGFIEMIIFIVILLIGYAYIWRKGALDWR